MTNPTDIRKTAGRLTKTQLIDKFVEIIEKNDGLKNRNRYLEDKENETETELGERTDIDLGGWLCLIQLREDLENDIKAHTEEDEHLVIIDVKKELVEKITQLIEIDTPVSKTGSYENFTHLIQKLTKKSRASKKSNQAQEIFIAGLCSLLRNIDSKTYPKVSSIHRALAAHIPTTKTEQSDLNKKFGLDYDSFNNIVNAGKDLIEDYELG